jgi:uncharacterized membrane protein YphA (DoxX/SURF4 family)
MFPNGWPGRGLLLLRTIVFSFVAGDTLQTISNANSHTAVIQKIAAVICAFFLFVGLGTPFAAIALSSCEIWIGISALAQWPLAIVVVGIAFSLAMLGPGSTSIDARLFGRKRIDFQSRDRI